MIAPYTKVDNMNRGDIQGQTHYVTINGKLLVLRFKHFHFIYISLRLLIMTVVKCLLVNTKKNIQKRVITTINKKTVVK